MINLYNLQSSAKAGGVVVVCLLRFVLFCAVFDNIYTKVLKTEHISARSAIGYGFQTRTTHAKTYVHNLRSQKMKTY